MNHKEIVRKLTILSALRVAQGVFSVYYGALIVWLILIVLPFGANQLPSDFFATRLDFLASMLVHLTIPVIVLLSLRSIVSHETDRLVMEVFDWGTSPENFFLDQNW